jgi:hypothetical protein
MGGLETSPQDPVFWLHHCYIDYLWEKFRERQKRLGINSEKDYPPTTDPFHQPNRVMDKLTPEKTNIEGYSNSFTRYIYQYAPAPTCANRCGRSYNAFLYCYKNRCFQGQEVNSYTMVALRKYGIGTEQKVEKS